MGVSPKQIVHIWFHGNLSHLPYDYPLKGQNKA